MPELDSVKTVKRSIDILNLLAEDGRQLGVIELSKRLKTSQSTIYRILATLAAEGTSRRIRARKSTALGCRASSSPGPLSTSSRSASRRSRSSSAWSRPLSFNANLGILHRQHMMYIARIDGPKSARMYTPIGRRAPAHATALGKAILAFCRPRRRRRSCAAAASSPPRPTRLSIPWSSPKSSPDRTARLRGRPGGAPRRHLLHRRAGTWAVGRRRGGAQPVGVHLSTARGGHGTTRPRATRRRL